jgi:parallel beta-helix repeat protein
MRYNDGGGVVVYNAGSVIMDDLTLDANGESNIFIDTVDDVTITDTVTTNSYENGIYIDDGGDITLSGITSNWNGWGNDRAGVYLDDSWGDIDISDSTFEGNYIGLSTADTWGDIFLDHVIVSGTGFEGFTSMVGVYLYETNGNITISDSTVNDNSYGVYLESPYSNITLTNVEINGNGDLGLSIKYGSGEENVEIVCSNVNDNGSGIYIDDVNDVTLSGVTATGNDEYDMDLHYDGELIELTGCKGAAQKEKEKEKDETAPEGKIVPVNGGENVPLDCGYLWTMLVLPEDSRAKFAGFCDMNAVFNHLPVESLPGEVPDGHTFVAGYSDSVEGSSGVMPNSGSAKLSLVVPGTESGKELVVLFWDAGAGKWVVVPMKGNEGSFSASDPAMEVLTGVQISSDGKVTFSVNFTGTFVVASK